MLSWVGTNSHYQVWGPSHTPWGGDSITLLGWVLTHNPKCGDYVTLPREGTMSPNLAVTYLSLQTLATYPGMQQ